MAYIHFQPDYFSHEFNPTTFYETLRKVETAQTSGYLEATDEGFSAIGRIQRFVNYLFSFIGITDKSNSTHLESKVLKLLHHGSMKGYLSADNVKATLRSISLDKRCSATLKQAISHIENFNARAKSGSEADAQATLQKSLQRVIEVYHSHNSEELTPYFFDRIFTAETIDTHGDREFGATYIALAKAKLQRRDFDGAFVLLLKARRALNTKALPLILEMSDKPLSDDNKILLIKLVKFIGQKAYVDKDYGKAFSYLLKARKLDPSFTHAIFSRNGIYVEAIQSLLDQNKASEALTLLNEALHFSPDSAAYKALVPVVHIKLGDTAFDNAPMVKAHIFATARPDYTKAISHLEIAFNYYEENNLLTTIERGHWADRYITALRDSGNPEKAALVSSKIASTMWQKVSEGKSIRDEALKYEPHNISKPDLDTKRKANVLLHKATLLNAQHFYRRSTEMSPLEGNHHFGLGLVTDYLRVIDPMQDPLLPYKAAFMNKKTDAYAHHCIVKEYYRRNDQAGVDRWQARAPIGSIDPFGVMAWYDYYRFADPKLPGTVYTREA